MHQVTEKYFMPFLARCYNADGFMTEICFFWALPDIFDLSDHCGG